VVDAAGSGFSEVRVTATILHVSGASSLRRQCRLFCAKRGYRFYCWTDEHNDPPHVQVASGDGYAKVVAAAVALEARFESRIRVHRSLPGAV
jgi:hypothetical protein